MIKDGYNGILIDDYQDCHSFAEAMVKLVQKPQILTEYSNNALRTAKKLTVEKAVLVWKDIIKTKGKKYEI